MEYHILNLHKILTLMKSNRTAKSLYYHLTLAFKGIPGHLDVAELKSVRKIIVDEHQKNLKFIDALIKKEKDADKHKIAA